MLHGATLGDEVTVGHSAAVDYAEVQGHLLVGMGNAVMGGVTVESNCIVAANAVVRQGQRIPEEQWPTGCPPRPARRATSRPPRSGHTRPLRGAGRQVSVNQNRGDGRAR